MELTETLLLIFAGSSFQSRTVEGKKEDGTKLDKYSGTVLLTIL
jgi:hypothetical protein